MPAKFLEDADGLVNLGQVTYFEGNRDRTVLHQITKKNRIVEGVSEQRMLNLFGNAGIQVVTLDLSGQETNNARVHVVASHISATEQTAPGSKVTLSTGKSMFVRQSTNQIVQGLEPGPVQVSGANVIRVPVVA